MMRSEVEWRVATLNVGSLTGRGGEVVEMMKRRVMNVLCIQETRWKGNSARELGEGFKVFYAGERSGRNGVGVVLDAELKECVVEVVRRGSRIMRVKLVVNRLVVNIVSVYAPQVGRSVAEKEEFWRNLDDVLGGVVPGERLIVAGDFNAHLGKDAGIFDEVHGGRGYGVRNREREEVLEMAVARGLGVVNTRFEKKVEQLITFKSAVGASQIDLILVDKVWIKEIRDCKVIPSEDLEGQHRLVLMRWRPEGNWRQETTVTEGGIRWWRLERNKETVGRKLREEVNWECDGTAEEIWTTVAVPVRECCRQKLGVVKWGGRKKGKETWWWNEEVEKAVNDKKKAYNDWRVTRDEEDRKKYVTLKRLAKRVVAEAKNSVYDRWYADLETKGGEKGIFKVARERAQQRKDDGRVKSVKADSGEVLIEEMQVRERWRQYFNKLLNEGDVASVTDVSEERGVDTERNTSEWEWVSEEEVVAALGKAKSAKAVGPDGIPNEVWKVVGERAIVWLVRLFNKLMDGDRMPDEWRQSWMVPLFKGKGDVQECKNYRGIKLMSQTLKVWERVVEVRLRQTTSISEEQFGFMPGKSTTEPMFIVRQMMEKFRAKKKSLHMVFVDLEKAYDRVSRKVLWDVLEKREVTGGLIRVIKDMYTGAETRIKTACGVSDSFEVKMGLHQGSALSPYLFVLILDELLKGSGLKAPWCLLFADDMQLAGESVEEVQESLELVRVSLEGSGLRINKEKTEYMCCEWGQAGGGGEVYLEGYKLKRVSEFKYLGSTLDEEAELEKEVSVRIQAGWGKWKEASGVLCDRKVPERVKGKFFAAVVRPAMLYGAECWATKQEHVRKLEVAQSRMCRWMMGVKWQDRLENEYVRQRIGVECVRQRLREGRLRWLGHVVRMEEESIVRRVRELDVEGLPRGRGRPKLTWDAVVKKDMQECGLREDMARDRGEWRMAICMPILAKLGGR